MVLNFSGSDQFLKCMYDKGKAVLTVEVRPNLEKKNVVLFFYLHFYGVPEGGGNNRI